MNVYIISYDLVAPGRDYKPVYRYIESFKDWIKPLQTVYLVRTSMSAAQIRDGLAAIVDANDKVFVSRLNLPEWASWNLSDSAASWLQRG